MLNNQKQKSKKSLIFILFIALLFIIVFSYLQNDSTEELPVNSDQEISDKEPTIPTKVTVPTPNSVPVNENKEECVNSNLNLKLDLPNNNWTCTVDTFGMDDGGADGAIYANNGFFNVVISSLGRGTFCTPPDTDPNSPRNTPDNTCETSTFYTNNGIELVSYSDTTGLHEIFGSQDGYNIAITYDDMANVELTKSQKDEIFELLDSMDSID